MHTRQESETKGHTKIVGEKKLPAMGIYIRRNTSRFATAKGPFDVAKAYYPAAKGSSLQLRTKPRSGEGGFVAAG